MNGYVNVLLMILALVLIYVMGAVIAASVILIDARNPESEFTLDDAVDGGLMWVFLVVALPTHRVLRFLRVDRLVRWFLPAQLKGAAGRPGESRSEES